MKKVFKKLTASLLAVALSVSTAMPALTAFAATSTDTAAITKENVQKVYNYADQLRKANVDINVLEGYTNTKGMHYTWDTEGKVDRWRYFNGVMMDAFMMLPDDANNSYQAFVENFYKWTTNEAGEVDNKWHEGELDSVPSALALFDLLERNSTNSETYKKTIQFVYSKLENQTSYSTCGGNFLHKDSWEDFQIGLDGLYMAQPFLMQCAKAIEANELTLKAADDTEVNPSDIYDAVAKRFAWVSEAMYDETTHLFHHGWNVTNNRGNGHFWSRAIGWYAMALVDVYEMMPAEQQNAMKTQLTKLLDGMLMYQDETTGLWYNVVNCNASLANNLLETSGSAMMAYALLKAARLGVTSGNNYDYKEAGLKAFNGIISQKMSGTTGSYTVADIYRNSGVCTSDSDYTKNDYVNDEAKGVGALLMAAVEAEKTTADNTTGGTTTETTPPPTTTTPPTTTPAPATVTYELVETFEAGQSYLIVNTNMAGTGYAMAYNAAEHNHALTTDPDCAAVAVPGEITVDGGKTYIKLAETDAATAEWTITAANNIISASTSDNHYLRFKTATDILRNDTKTQGFTITKQTNGGFWIYKDTRKGANSSNSLVFDGAAWTITKNDSNTVYLYKKVTSGTTTTDPGSNPDSEITEVDKTKENWDLPVATSYPEYPDDGAVRINKAAINDSSLDFTSTGVTQIELAAAGVSVKKGTDVIIVMDMSNSMLWEPGQTTPVETGNKFEMAKDATQRFANTLLGSGYDNTMSLVYFCSADDERNTDAAAPNTVDVAFDRVKTAEDVATKLATLGTGTPKFSFYYSTEENKHKYYWPGGTNYDYPFEETLELIKEMNDDPNRDQTREIAVVFMSDGAPGYYNGTYYKAAGDSDYRKTAYTDKNKTTLYENSATAFEYDQGKDGQFSSKWGEYISQPLKNAQDVKNAGATIYSVGFDVASGNQLETKNSWTNISSAHLTACLKGISSNGVVYSAENSAALNKVFTTLAENLTFAGTEAEVTDVIGPDFTLYTGTQSSAEANSTVPSAIQVTLHDLYTKDQVDGINVTDAMVGTRTGTNTILETVTFSEDGTQAFSSVKEANANILESDGTISAKYFTYTKAADGTETFKWNIGNITDKEAALTYYAYLKDSMQGNRASGTYDTNKEAYLEYVDINNNYAKQIYKVPNRPWKGASTTYEYYLVNEQGNPVNSNGYVIPFANRVTVGEPTTKNFSHNSTVIVTAFDKCPEGYALYDGKAGYTVTVYSGGNGADSLTLHGEHTETTKWLDEQDGNFNETHVAFAVYRITAEPVQKTPMKADTVVIDYGKKLPIDVTANDTDTYQGYTMEVVGVRSYDATIDPELVVTGTSFPSESAGAQGVFAVEAIDNVDTVTFTPSKMMDSVEKAFAVVKVTNTTDETDYFYMYNEVDVIPATVMYYETEFAYGVFDFAQKQNGTDGGKWRTVKDNDTTTVGHETTYHFPKENQDDGEIGNDKVFGYDKSYENDSKLSDGSSWFVEGEGYKYTYNEFTFTGTGFDLISRTGAQQGVIRVEVWKPEIYNKWLNAPTKEEKDAFSPEKTLTVSNKSDTNLELYQIPVLSVDMMDKGGYLVKVKVSTPYDCNLFADEEKNKQLSYGNEFYFDAVRIYNPVDADAAGNEIVQAAYMASGEYNPTFTEIRNELINAKDFDVNATNAGVTFVDRTNGGKDSEVANGADISEYTNIGPNNEVYLLNGQAIGFKLMFNGTTPASVDLGIKTIKADVGATAQIKVAPLNTDGTVATDGTVGTEKTVNTSSATVQFTALDIPDSTDGMYIYVTNSNTTEGSVLSLTDIKVAYGESASVAAAPAAYMVSDAASAACTVALLEASLPKDLTIREAAFAQSSVRLFRKADLTVVTSADAESIKVTNWLGVNMAKDAACVDNGDGTKTWTVSFGINLWGTNNYKVTAYDMDGNAGEPTTVSISAKLF